MIKKRVLPMMLVMVMISGALNGCGAGLQSGNGLSAESKMTEPEEKGAEGKTGEAEGKAAEGKTGEEKAAEGKMNETEGKAGESLDLLTAKKLDPGEMICIDYSEPSMEPVQEFAYEMLSCNLKKKNPVFSPVSAYLALCMAANGAQGKTKKELQRVLGEDLLCLPDYVMNLLPQKKEGFTLEAANSVWMDQEFHVEKPWLTQAVSLFDASVYEADLDTAAARKDINAWVSSQTNKMIPKLLSANLDRSTRLALLNALYFQAEWENKFEVHYTAEGEFRLDNGSVQKVPMMYQLYSGCEYIKDASCEGVVLPYKNSGYAFVAVKPVGKKSIRKWYQSYSAEKLQKLIAGRKSMDVDLGLVKFQARCSQDLVGSLKKMGIARAFDPVKADFTRLGTSSQGNSLYIGKVLQEAVVEVAEEGTKAAAATVVSMEDGCGMIDPVPVVFDRSFLYLIMDMEHGMPVFMGIMDQPTE